MTDSWLISGESTYYWIFRMLTSLQKSINNNQFFSKILDEIESFATCWLCIYYLVYILLRLKLCDNVIWAFELWHCQ